MARASARGDRSVLKWTRHEQVSVYGVSKKLQSFQAFPDERFWLQPASFSQ